MVLQKMPASEAREKFADLLDHIESGRMVITRHGEDKAVLISARELASIEETLAVLEDDALKQAIVEGLAAIRDGHTEPARDVFARLDQELNSGE